MFDAKLRPLIDPPLNAIGRTLATWGVSANLVTFGGLILGIGAGVALSQREFGLGLVLLLASRLLDGFDGAVARATRITDFGGYLDSVADYGFYISVPLGFAFADRANMPFMLLLIAAFILTAVSFLAFATIAAKRGLETDVHGQKSFFYSTGLAEGAETIVAFALMCLWPDKVPLIAMTFAGMCILTVVQRTLVAKQIFAMPDRET